MEYKTFETERLIIRPTSENDAAFVFELLNTPKWIKYIGDRNVKTLKDSREYIKTKMIPNLKSRIFENFKISKVRNKKLFRK